MREEQYFRLSAYVFGTQKPLHVVICSFHSTAHIRAVARNTHEHPSHADSWAAKSKSCQMPPHLVIKCRSAFALRQPHAFAGQPLRSTGHASRPS